MAHVSTGVEYAFHCLVYLVDAQELEQPVSAGDLAELQQVPADFVRKLFTKLQKTGIVASRDGIGGGFVLARPAGEISALDIVEAIDGRKALFDCKGIRTQCALFRDGTPAWATDGVCSIHAVMLEAEQRTREVMATHTLASIAGRVKRKAPADYSASVNEWLAGRTPRRGRRAKTVQ